MRHQLGDSVDYDPVTNVYTENFNGEHSPIIAWVDDGLPVYGPYGYDDPLDADSGVRRMISGFQLRSDNTRASWPAWATRIYEITGRSFLPGPAISANFPLGRYVEDNDYKGDLGMTLTWGDLNEYNVRWCVTGSNGIWAYFTCIEADGAQPTISYVHILVSQVTSILVIFQEQMIPHRAYNSFRRRSREGGSRDRHIRKHYCYRSSNHYLECGRGWHLPNQRNK